MPRPRRVVASSRRSSTRAEVGADGAVVLDGVSPVVVAVAGLQQRHQVEVGDAERLEVVEPRGQPGQVVGVPLGVAGVAEHPRLLQPVGLQQPALVEAVQVVGAVDVRAGRDVDQPARHGAGIGVHDREPVEQVTPPAVQAEPELLAPRLAGRGRHLGRGRLHVVGGSHRLHSNACGQEAPCGDAVS